MEKITASPTALMKQAHMTADEYLRQAIKAIDARLGDGYASRHPELTGAFLQTAALDYGAATLAAAIQDLTDAIPRGMRD